MLALSPRSRALPRVIAVSDFVSNLGTTELFKAFEGQGRIEPYNDGIIVCMKKTLHIDENLLRDAKSASGAKTDTDTVRLGLEALVRRAAYERLRALRGSEPRVREIRRRRERTS